VDKMSDPSPTIRVILQNLKDLNNSLVNNTPDVREALKSLFVSVTGLQQQLSALSLVELENSLRVLMRNFLEAIKKHDEVLFSDSKLRLVTLMKDIVAQVNQYNAQNSNNNNAAPAREKSQSFTKPLLFTSKSDGFLQSHFAKVPPSPQNAGRPKSFFAPRDNEDSVTISNTHANANISANINTNTKVTTNTTNTNNNNDTNPSSNNNNNNNNNSNSSALTSNTSNNNNNNNAAALKARNSKTFYVSEPKVSPTVPSPNSPRLTSKSSIHYSKAPEAQRVESTRINLAATSLIHPIGSPPPPVSPPLSSAQSHSSDAPIRSHGWERLITYVASLQEQPKPRISEPKPYFVA